MRIVPLMITLLLLTLLAGALPTTSALASSGVAAPSHADHSGKHSRRIKPAGKTGKTLAAEHKKHSSVSAYSHWKRRLPFWPRKIIMLLELVLFIAAGVFIGQILEETGCVRALSIITWPVTTLGKISRAAGPAFLMAFQSGAVANSMLVSLRDSGELDNRELYTSVFVVSALSLFAHLPTFVVPIGMAFGWEATCALFGVRVGAIVAQIVVTLLVSRLVVARLGIGSGKTVKDEIAPLRQGRVKKGSFWGTIWRRSRFTLTRLIIYLIPTFIVLATLEYYGAFKWLGQAMPQLFTFNFLPPQSVAIIPAQALSLYNGAIAAANFIDSGAISVHQAVIIILFGSMVTSPVRTLRHALPTYVAILGARPGLIMAISAQVLRMLFLLAGTLLLMAYWF